MKDTFFLEQKSRTGNLDAILLLRQHKLFYMARFMEIKSINPKKRKSEITKELGYSSSTLHCYRYDIKMQRPYKSNNLKRPENDRKDANETDRPVPTEAKKKNTLRVGDPNDVNPSHGSILNN